SKVIPISETQSPVISSTIWKPQQPYPNHFSSIDPLRQYESSRKALVTEVPSINLRSRFNYKQDTIQNSAISLIDYQAGTANH
ncbi:hypothetical protein LINGRAPRIM_LOCUS227, partial [Linum grandiflorum]